MSGKLAQRLLERSEEGTNGCWNFKTLGRNGYGYISVNNRVRLAHRVSYEVHKGTIDDGLQIDHLCRNRACINPEHLEAVTPKENSRRGLTGIATGKRNRAKRFCPKGHPYSEKNTYRYIKNNKYLIRECRQCRNRSSAIYRGKFECQTV